MPEILELSNLRVNLASLLVLIEDSISLNVVALSENIDELLGLAGLEGDVALERAAGVGVKVHVVAALAALYSNRI